MKLKYVCRPTNEPRKLCDSHMYNSLLTQLFLYVLYMFCFLGWLMYFQVCPAEFFVVLLTKYITSSTAKTHTQLINLDIF